MSQKTTPSTMKKLGAKVPTRVAYLPDGGLGGWGCPARLYSPDILTASSCCQGAWEPRKADRTAISMDCCKAPY